VIQLNHTIVHGVDRDESARFFAEVFGRPEPTSFGPFLIVELDNGVSLDFAGDGSDVTPQHYAFLVGEDDFDAIFGRVRERGLTYYPGPSLEHEGSINHNDGGRGVYFMGPEGHFYEILTVPYGGWPA
jgi:extradiol dioxygenase family protein